MLLKRTTDNSVPFKLILKGPESDISRGIFLHRIISLREKGAENEQGKPAQGPHIGLGSFNLNFSWLSGHINLEVLNFENSNKFNFMFMLSTKTWVAIQGLSSILYIL